MKIDEKYIFIKDYRDGGFLIKKGSYLKRIQDFYYVYDPSGIIMPTVFSSSFLTNGYVERIYNT